jgi:hypothetical protein
MTVAFTVLLSGPTAVQSQFLQGMGLKAGLSLADQRYRFTPIDYTLETDPVAGPSAALFIETFRHEHLSVQMDLSFAVKGSKTTTRSVTVNHLDNDRIEVNKGDLRTSRHTYLSVSPMARYRMNREGMNPYFLLGPRLDYLLTYRTDSDYPLEEQNSIVLGLSGGMGVELDLQKLGVFLEVQYQPDLSHVSSREPLRITNNLFFIALGVRVRNAP